MRQVLLSSHQIDKGGVWIGFPSLVDAAIRADQIGQNELSIIFQRIEIALVVLVRRLQRVGQVHLDAVRLLGGAHQARLGGHLGPLVMVPDRDREADLRGVHVLERRQRIFLEERDPYFHIGIGRDLADFNT